MASHSFKTNLQHFIHLTRLNKPVGIWLLLWPTLWGVWLASNGQPNSKLIIIFTLGVILMRSAGCIINDIADHRFDRHVERTSDRPLAAEKISLSIAWLWFVLLSLCAASLLIWLNPLTRKLAIVAVLITMIYPWMKRFIHAPQLILGIAFALGIPMAYAQVQQSFPLECWWLFFIAVIWPIVYDTWYAMVDREDDKKIGIKSTAIWFGEKDRCILLILQLIIWVLLLGLGWYQPFSWLYFALIFLSVFFIAYQHYSTRDRSRQVCFQAFLRSHWFGLLVLIAFVFN